MNTTPNQHVTGAGIGGALGFIAVWALSKYGDAEIGPEEAAALTAAAGVIFSWAVRWLPKPHG